ncbi:hypothetical protein D3C78_1740920 [compost metagenome]
MTDRLQHPEVEVMGVVIVPRVREIAVVALGGGFDRSGVLDHPRLGQIGQSPHGLYVFGLALAHQQ